MYYIKHVNEFMAKVLVTIGHIARGIYWLEAQCPGIVPWTSQLQATSCGKVEQLNRDIFSVDFLNIQLIPLIQ